MKIFLVKTEPSTYSIDDMQKEDIATWDGVHNHEAINYIKQMQPGDKVYVYHSMKDKKIVGVAEVCSEPYLNTEDPRFSWAVKMKFVRRVNGPELADFKQDTSLPKFKLVTHSRLSVMEVPQLVSEWIEKRLTAL